MQIIAVTTCTNRKKFPVPVGLSAASLATGLQVTVAHSWRKRVKSAPATGLAIDVYCGRNFQEANQAARAARADFRIISGGLGLVQGQEPIVNRRSNLTPDRRPILTPSGDGFWR
jgi:hypothetical protein